MSAAEDELFKAEQEFRRETIDTFRLIRLHLEQLTDENRALANRIESVWRALNEHTEHLA